MDFSNERYVRLYTRKTIQVLMWCWEAQAIYPHVLAACDRSGRIDIHGAEPWEAIAALLPKWPPDVVRVGVEAMMEGSDPTIVVDGGAILWPKFADGDAVRTSAAERKRASRARRSQPVTRGHNQSHAVTTSHTRSQNVTPCDAASPHATPRLTTPHHATPTPQPPTGGQEVLTPVEKSSPTAHDQIAEALRDARSRAMADDDGTPKRANLVALSPKQARLADRLVAEAERMGEPEPTAAVCRAIRRNGERRWRGDPAFRPHVGLEYLARGAGDRLRELLDNDDLDRVAVARDADRSRGSPRRGEVRHTGREEFRDGPVRL